MTMVREMGPRIELYLQDRLLLGDWAPEHDRLLDALEIGGRLVLHRAHAVPLGAGPPAVLGTVIVPAAGILLAIPPEPSIRPAPAVLWRPRRRMLSRADLGPLRIVGTVHLEAGPSPAETPTARRRPFLAVTEALVSRADDPGTDETHPLVLVARAAIEAWFPIAGAPASR